MKYSTVKCIVCVCVCVCVCVVDVWSLVFSADSRLLATGSHNGKINLFSVEEGSKQSALDTRGKFIMSIAYVRTWPTGEQPEKYHTFEGLEGEVFMPCVGKGISKVLFYTDVLVKCSHFLLASCTSSLHIFKLWPCVCVLESQWEADSLGRYRRHHQPV